MFDDAARFRLHLDRASRLEKIAVETNEKTKRTLILRMAKDACMWSPSDPSDDDLALLYQLARTAVVAEGNARTRDFQKKWGIEITTFTIPEQIG